MKRFFALMMCLALLVPFGLSNASADQTQYVDSSEIPPLSSALHVLSPIGNNNEKTTQTDQTLTDFLLVKICQVNGGECTPAHEFTSQKNNKGLDYIKLQNKFYHVNWNVSKSDSGKTFEVHFLAAGLDIGNVTYTPKNGRTIPIRFQIDNHPRIRARVLHEQGYLALDVARILSEDFDLDIIDLSQVLYEENYPILEIGTVLRDEFGLDAVEMAQVFREIGCLVIEIGQVFKDVLNLEAPDAAQILHDMGYSAASVADVLMSVYGLALHEARTILRDVGYSEEEIIQIFADDLAAKFAPQLRFDSGEWTCPGRDSYPMSAQEYYVNVIKEGATLTYMNNADSSTVTNHLVPTYWKVFLAGLKQIRIVYWWYYGYQDDCDGTSGEHNGDWEHVVVILSEDTSRIAAVVYFQHGGHYTRIAAQDGFDVADVTHPVVYVGRTNHGSYHNSQTAFQTCCYWEDHRDGEDVWFNAWESPLIKLQLTTDGGEEWMDADLVGGFLWGPDGVSNHPMANPSGAEGTQTCEGTSTWGCQTSGCFRSQCEVGDRDDGITCWHCPSGYIDWGTFCVKDCSWYPFCRSTSISTYGLEYPISNSDAGLLYKNPYP